MLDAERFAGSGVLVDLAIIIYGDLIGSSFFLLATKGFPEAISSRGFLKFVLELRGL